MTTHPTSADVPTWTPPTDRALNPAADLAAPSEPEPVTYHPPLTEAEFNEGAATVSNGVTLVDNEDGDYVFAYGHRDRVEFAVAVNAYDLDVNGESGGYLPSDVKHLDAVTLSPPDGPDGWRISWHRPIVEASDQPTFPVTVVDR